MDHRNYFYWKIKFDSDFRQPWKLEEVQKVRYSLIQKVIKKYNGKHVKKELLLRKCHVRFILHFTLAAEGYIYE